MTTQKTRPAPNSDVIQRDEFTLGAIALVITLGLLKANELFDLFEKVDVFVLTGTTLTINGLHLIAFLGFLGCYLIFMALAFFAVLRISVREGMKFRHPSMGFLAVIIVTLATTQFFALALGCTHLREKYLAQTGSAKAVIWSMQ